MAKLTKDDFTKDEDGDFNAGVHWVMVYRCRGGFSARVSSSEWYSAMGVATVGSGSGFASEDDALQWGIDCINDIPLRLACAALETAFEAMAEWLPLVLPALATARAEAALAEREACAEILGRASNYKHDALEWLPLGDPRARELVEARDALTDALDAIRARTTPATFSTDTLAAIAEARGLRVVEPELVADVPVLRWECDLHSIARCGQWVLEADSEEWTVWVDSPGPVARLLVAGATTERAERAVNRSAAEGALRKLGVAFRTE